MSPRFAHFVITRFSVRAPGDTQRYRDPEWLRGRLDLLRRFGAQSLRDQTDSGFTWLLFADDQSPQWVRDGLSEVSTGIDTICCFTEPGEWKANLAALLDSRRSGDAPIITTRLDSDDLIHRDFIRVVADAAEPDIVMNMPIGYRLRTDQMRLFRVRNKRTFEVLCTASSQHIFNFGHGTAGRSFRSVDVRAEAGMWIQTVHGENLANTSTRGQPFADADGFDMLTGQIARPRLIDELRHRASEARNFAGRITAYAQTQMSPHRPPASDERPRSAR